MAQHKTLTRASERRESRLLQVVAEQNDRIMHLAGLRDYSPSPPVVLEEDEELKKAKEEAQRLIQEGWVPYE